MTYMGIDNKMDLFIKKIGSVSDIYWKQFTFVKRNIVYKSAVASVATMILRVIGNHGTAETVTHDHASNVAKTTFENLDDYA